MNSHATLIAALGFIISSRGEVTRYDAAAALYSLTRNFKAAPCMRMSRAANQICRFDRKKPCSVAEFILRLVTRYIAGSRCVTTWLFRARDRYSSHNEVTFHRCRSIPFHFVFFPRIGEVTTLRIFLIIVLLLNKTRSHTDVPVHFLWSKKF